MKRVYLWGFVKDCSEIPSVEGFYPNLTFEGERGVVWSLSPLSFFATKASFLTAMAVWLTRICDSRMTFLPVQQGICAEEENLVRILSRYGSSLEANFNKIEGCWEYIVGLRVPGTEKIISRAKAQSGREYLGLVKMEYMERENARQTTLHFAETLVTRLAKWIRNYQSDISFELGLTNLAFLVPYKLATEFCSELDRLSGESGWITEYSGPWPPFHFSSFHFSGESLLGHELLTWGQRGGENGEHG